MKAVTRTPRDEVKALARANDPETRLACNHCGHQVKAKNLVKHYDKEHGAASPPLVPIAHGGVVLSRPLAPSFKLSRTPRWIEHPEVLAALKRHEHLSSLSIAPDIPDRRADKIRMAFRLEAGESLMGSFDYTLFGTGGNFLAVTSRRLLYRYGGDRHEWLLSELDPADVKPAAEAGSASTYGLWIDGTEIPSLGDPSESVALLHDVLRAVGSR